MATLLIEYQTDNFDAWKAIFDRDPMDRQSHGVTDHHIHRDTQNPNRVLLSLDFDSTPKARAFREALQPMWEISGAQRAWVLPGTDTETRCFLYKLVPPRPTFPMDMTPSEQQVMGQHVGYWQELTADGTALVFGPILDPAGSWGAAVVKASSREEVEAIGVKDPAVTSGVATFQVYDMPDAITAI